MENGLIYARTCLVMSEYVCFVNADEAAVVAPSLNNSNLREIRICKICDRCYALCDG